MKKSMTIEQVATVLGLDVTAMRHRWYRPHQLPLYVGKTNQWQHELEAEEVNGRRIVDPRKLMLYLREQERFHSWCAQRCAQSKERLARSK